MQTVSDAMITPSRYYPLFVLGFAVVLSACDRPADRDASSEAEEVPGQAAVSSVDEAAGPAGSVWSDGRPISHNLNTDIPREPLDEWRTLYDMETGFNHEPPIHSTWLSPQTRSELTPEGLRIIDPTSKQPSGHFYFLDWDVDPEKGGAVEATMKPLSGTTKWGAAVLVTDGVHEEGVSFLPDQIMLSHKEISVPFDCSGGFRTYRIEFKGADIRVFADDELVLDGAGQFTHPAAGTRNRVGFGSASNAATGDSLWQSVRYRSGGRVFMPEVMDGVEMPGLRAKVVETRKMFNFPWPSLLQLANGDLIIRGNRSSDGGKTWQSVPHDSTWTAFEFKDGEILELGYHTKAGSEPDTWETTSHRTLPGGERQKETTVLHVPGAPTKGDDSMTYGIALGHGVIEMDDGSLIGTAFGRLEGDEETYQAFGWTTYKSRTMLVRSTDRGRTWHYATTIARDPEIGMESFCEPWLLKLPDGDILCFMRTGGYLSAVDYTPIHLSRSKDQGQTWSEPVPITDRGVMPRAKLLDNGVIALSYGRNGCWLAFSLDNGHTWTGHFCYAANPSFENNHMAVLENNRLLLFHDDTSLGRDGKPANITHGTYIDVERTTPPEQ
jgi:hypothetical protein